MAYSILPKIGSPLVRLSTIVFAFFTLTVASRAYYSERLLVMAEGGRKTIRDYEGLLAESISSNPYNGAARLRLADLKFSQQDYQQTVNQLQITSQGQNHWKGWERLGAVYERMAFQSTGTEADVELAESFYDDVLTVNPTYEAGIERRSILALKRGEWGEVEDYALRLQELDANNKNAVYIRARAAEALGNGQVAIHLYSQLLAESGSSTDTLYNKADVVEHLQILKSSTAY